MSRDEAKVQNAASANANGKAEGLGTNSQIGRKLKQYYDDLVTDEVPDKFLELLTRLDSTEKSQSEKRED